MGLKFCHPEGAVMESSEGQVGFRQLWPTRDTPQTDVKEPRSVGGASQRSARRAAAGASLGETTGRE